jgi:hypothetical protein
MRLFLPKLFVFDTVTAIQRKTAAADMRSRQGLFLSYSGFLNRPFEPARPICLRLTITV